MIARIANSKISLINGLDRKFVMPPINEDFGRMLSRPKELKAERRHYLDLIEGQGQPSARKPGDPALGKLRHQTPSRVDRSRECRTPGRPRLRADQSVWLSDTPRWACPKRRIMLRVG
jgi:hypothetical protein